MAALTIVLSYISASPYVILKLDEKQMYISVESWAT